MAFFSKSNLLGLFKEVRLQILFLTLACLITEDLVILVDRSASFHALDKQRNYIPFIERLVDSLPDGISVEVSEFSLKVKPIFQAASLNNESKEKFKGLLYTLKSVEAEDSAAEVLNFLLSKKPKVAILFTDGVFSDLEESNSLEGVSELLKKLREASIKLVILSPDGAVNQDFLFEASAVTKGLNLSFTSKGSFKSVMIEVLKSFSEINLDSFLFFSVPAQSLVVFDHVCQEINVIDPDFKISSLVQFRHFSANQRCFTWIDTVGEWGVLSDRTPQVLQSPQVFASIPSNLLAGEIATAQIWIHSLGNKIAFNELLNQTKVQAKIFKEGIVGDALIGFPLNLNQKTKNFEGEFFLNDVGNYNLTITLEGPFEGLGHEQKLKIKDESVKFVNPANVKDKLLKELSPGSWVFLEGFKGGIFHKVQANSDVIKTFNSLAALKLTENETNLTIFGELKTGKTLVRFNRTLELSDSSIYLAKEAKSKTDLLKTSLIVFPPQLALFGILLLILLKGNKQKFSDEFSGAIEDLKSELLIVKSYVQEVQSKDVDQLLHYMSEFFSKSGPSTQTEDYKVENKEE